MHIWVTGGAGFLGSHLVRAFTSRGYGVTSLSRGKNPPAHCSVSLDLASESCPETLRALIRNSGSPDIVIHTAARKSAPLGWSEYVRSNVLTTAWLLDVLMEYPPRQFIYTSTLSVFGRPERNPVRETDPVKGNFSYAVTKWWAEQVVEPLQQRSQTIILRLPSLYGAGQADSFIDGLARLALRNDVIEIYDKGEVIRDALHVEDVVAAILSCTSSPPGDRFLRLNLGCGQPITSRRYVEELVLALKSKSRILPVNKPSPQAFDLYADIREAQRYIGFSPTPLPASMERYAIELRSQG